MTSKLIEALNKCETQKSYENVRYTLVDDELRAYIEERLEALANVNKKLRIDISNLNSSYLDISKENEKLKNENQELIECIKTMVFCGIQDKYPLESGMLSNEQWRKMWDTYHKYCEKEVLSK